MPPAIEVALLHWPREREQRTRLAAAMLPRLLLVASRDRPPTPGDDLEDWIRLPADERDVAARLRSLSDRAERSLAATVVVDGHCLRRGDTTVLLSPSEAAFAGQLVERPGQLVARDELADVIWTNATPGPKALDDIAYRLRRRLARVGLDVLSARGRGFVLHVAPPIHPGMVE